MPINNLRVVDPVNNSLRSKEFVERQNLRDVYAKNLSLVLVMTPKNF